MSGDSIRQIQREYGVATLGGTILHNVFPLLAVFVFLLFAPGIASRKIKSLRIGGPGKVVYFLGPAGYGKSLTAVWINQVNLVNALVFLARIVTGVLIRILGIGFSV